MRLLFALLILFIGCWSQPALAITKVLGAAVDQFTAPPIGVCSTSFNMASGGVLTIGAVGESDQIQLGVGPLEDSYYGRAYLNARTGAGDTKLYTVSLFGFTVNTPININTANIPDVGASMAASHYNSFLGTWVAVGRQTTAPCNVTNCVHIRGYTNAVIGADISTLRAANSLTYAGTAVDSTATYIQYDTSGGPRFDKYTSGTYTQLDSNQAGESVFGMTTDDTYLYMVLGTTSTTLRRYLKGNISAGATNFTPGFTTNTVRYPNYYENNLYFAGRSLGASANILYRVSTATVAVTGTLSLANANLFDKVLIDPVNRKLYAVTTTGTDVQVTRVNMDTLANEQTFVGTTTVNGLSQGQTQIDVPHQAIYAPLLGSGGDAAKLQKINLCS